LVRSERTLEKRLGRLAFGEAGEDKGTISASVPEWMHPLTFEVYEFKPASPSAQ
jgi:hypothetical protein